MVDSNGRGIDEDRTREVLRGRESIRRNLDDTTLVSGAVIDCVGGGDASLVQCFPNGSVYLVFNKPQVNGPYIILPELMVVSPSLAGWTPPPIILVVWIPGAKVAYTA